MDIPHLYQAKAAVSAFLAATLPAAISRVPVLCPHHCHRIAIAPSVSATSRIVFTYINKAKSNVTLRKENFQRGLGELKVFVPSLRLEVQLQMPVRSPNARLIYQIKAT